MRTFQALSIIGLVAALSAGIPAKAEPPESIVRAFEHPGRVVLDEALRDLSGLRTRYMSMDMGLLFGDAAVRGGRAEELVVFNLFADRMITAQRKVVDLGIGETPMWFGGLVDDPDGYALFVMHGDAAVGKVHSPKFGVFEVIVTGGGFVEINEKDPTKDRPCAADHRHEDRNVAGHVIPEAEGEQQAMNDDERGAESGTFIFADVLTVYTSLAASQIGGTNAMLAWINAEIAETNMVYMNSLINLRIRNAGTYEVNYTQDSQNMGVDLSRITNFDGIMDEVHTIRNNVGADLVALIVPGPAPNACGIAWLMTSVGPSFQSLAFSVTARANCGEFVFAHELGHNMGCAHDRDNAGGASWPFAYGYRTPGNAYRTVMAYSPGVWSAFFSNPNVIYQGFAMGVPIGQPNPCHNAQAINNNAPTIAAWRTLFTEQPGAFSLIDPSNGSTTSDRTPDFSWSAASQTDYYRLEVDNDPGFGSPELVAQPLTTTSYSPSSSPPLALQPGQMYHWRVTAFNPLGSRLSSPASYTFTTPSLAPASFSLTTPVDGAINVSRNPSFLWTQSNDADSYTITVDNDPGFGSPEINVSGIQSVFYNWNGTPLAPLTTYHWKVTAVNAIGQTVGSPMMRSFTTVGSPPGSFSLLSPPDGAVITTTGPTLTWTASQFSDSYRLIVDNDQNLLSPVIDINVGTALSFNILPGTLSNTVRYYWQVRSINAGGTTNSSPAIATFVVFLPVCLGDANGDRIVNFQDISTVLANWGGSGPQGDADNNGTVNFTDISTVLSQWGTFCSK